MKANVAIVCVALVSLALAAIPGDLVTPGSLSGLYGSYKLPIYSGYLKVNATKYHHYTFFPSQGNPTTDPLVLWLNGGPGCSSSLGFLYEHGPYVFIENTTDFEPNPYSWNLNASVIYMESPAYVGYSYAAANYTYDDEITASDNLAALLSWFQGFSEYKTNDFYVVGESYGGVYVPTLSYKIDRYNQNATSPINLKGFGVGNGVTDWNVDTSPADPDMLWGSTQYSPVLRNAYQTLCNGETPANPTPQCQYVLNEISNLTSNIELNIYDIYRTCFYTVTNGPAAVERGDSFEYLRFKKLNENRSIVPDTGNVPGAPICLDSKGANAWMNDAGNKKALNIKNPIDQSPLNISWGMCSDASVYNSGPNASYWVYPLMINKGYKITIYSGNADASVPTVGTKKWLENLRVQEQLPVLVEPTKFYTNGQVAGFYTVIEGGITFVQVNGVGHMVPQWHRPAGKKIIDHLVNGVPL